MSIQLASTDTLQVVLAAAPAANQLPINASYVDQGGAGDNLPSITNGTTPVTFVGSPASGVERLVSQISICNDDTASVNVTVNLVRSGTAYRQCKTTLQPGFALYYDSGWKVLDTSGNFLCNVTVNSGTITSNQGTAAAITAPWPVELSNGTNAVGTLGSPLRIDPTGTTQQPVNIADLAGSALGGPTAWGVAPASGTPVLNVNANIVSGGSGGGNVNVTEWNTIALGSPSSYGTSPGAVAVIGVNAFVTNLPSTQPISGSVSVSNFPATQASNQTQLAGTALGAPSNYGTSPGAVSVPGVNAFVTNQVNAQLVAGSAAIGTVGVTSIPTLPAGSNTIGAVNQGTNPWAISGTVSQGGLIAGIGSQPASSTTPISLGLGGSARTLRSLYIFLINPVLAAGAVSYTLKDGAGNTLLVGFLPAATVTSTTFLGPILDVNDLNIPASNTSGPFTVTLSANLTSGSYLFTVGAT